MHRFHGKVQGQLANVDSLEHFHAGRREVATRLELNELAFHQGELPVFVGIENVFANAHLHQARHGGLGDGVDLKAPLEPGLHRRLDLLGHRRRGRLWGGGFLGKGRWAQHQLGQKYG